MADYYNKQTVDNLCQKRGHWWGTGKGTSITLPSDGNAVYLLMYGYKTTMRNYGLIFNQFTYGSSDLFYYDVLKQDNWFATPTVEKDGSNIKVTINYGDGSVVNIIRLA